MKVFAYEGAWHLDHIVIVGIGGTGSALARLTARMLWQRKEAGQSVPTLILIDPDTVERHNIIRQGFAPSEISTYKSQAIALRYSLAYGLPIEYVTEAFDHEKHLPSSSILIDCTDNYLARREIVKGLEVTKSTVISAGNDTTFGQVCIGNTGDREQIEGAIQNMESDDSRLRVRDGIFHPCYHLPHFGLIYPELLEPEPPKVDTTSDLSCGELLALGEQHPMVNEQVSLTVAGYLFKLLHRQPITSFTTTVDVHNFHSESRHINPAELRAALSRNQAEAISEQPTE